MPDRQPPSKPPFKLSPETVKAMEALTPKQREDALRVASKVLALKAARKKAPSSR